MAPFIDGGRSIDRTNWSTTVISYYPYGGAIALAMDLTLRDRSDGKISLDDFMRAMWKTYGKPGGSRARLRRSSVHDRRCRGDAGAVSGDKAFAHDFFARYIQGHDVADYPRLLARAGFTVKKRNPGRAWLGDLRLDSRDGWRVAGTGAADLADLRRRHRRRRRAAAGGRAAHRRQRRHRDADAASQARRHGADRLRRSHRRRRRPRASRSSRIRTSRWCRSKAARSPPRRRPFAISGWGRSNAGAVAATD